MFKKQDSTPAVIKIFLIFVFAGTLISDFTIYLKFQSSSLHNTSVSYFLWLFTFLFILRVAGQIPVAVRPVTWLPPMNEWNLLPYRILLPVQLVFIIVMSWINLTFSNILFISETNISFGISLIIFSAVYAFSMPVRYIIRMKRRADQRWFGGTIPMVFHIVLASYLFTLGLYFYEN